MDTALWPKNDQYNASHMYYINICVNITNVRSTENHSTYPSHSHKVAHFASVLYNRISHHMCITILVCYIFYVSQAYDHFRSHPAGKLHCVSHLGLEWLYPYRCITMRPSSIYGYCLRFWLICDWHICDRPNLHNRDYKWNSIATFSNWIYGLGLFDSLIKFI